MTVIYENTKIEMQRKTYTPALILPKPTEAVKNGAMYVAADKVHIFNILFFGQNRKYSRHRKIIF